MEPHLQKLYERVSKVVGSPAIKLAPSSAQTLSFTGGAPMTSSAFEWPTHQGQALAFLCQIELGEFDLKSIGLGLPERGKLLFFYDTDTEPWGFRPQDRGGWKVIYTPDEGAAPALISPASPSAEPKFLRPQPYLSIPSGLGWAEGTLDLSAEEEDHLFELTANLFDGHPHHQIGGHTDAIQGDEMEEECQLVTAGIDLDNSKQVTSRKAKKILKRPNDWQLLLQFGSDEDQDFVWGSGGNLFFWIRQSDLEALRFEDVWLRLQRS